MTLLKLQQIERRKLHRRHLPALFLGVLLFETLWLTYALHDLGTEELMHGFHMLLLNVPILNTIFFPITLAVAASRLCEMEFKGDTLKQLCTLETLSDIYLTKVLFGIRYSLFLAAAQPCIMYLIGYFFHFTQDFLTEQIGYLTLLIFLLNITIFLIQLLLSLWIENQLIPLFVGLFGSFYGLLGLFLPRLNKFVLWGYYVHLSPVDMYWDPSTHITSYFDKPCNWMALLILAALNLLLCLAGNYIFCRKEI